MMATTSITFRLDENTKKKAEAVIQQMGVTTTSVLNAFMVAVAREGKLPFELMGDEQAYHQVIRKELEESIREAAEPNVKKIDYEVAMKGIKAKYGI